MKPILIPFSTDGSVPFIPDPQGAYDWRENFIFSDTLRFIDYCRGSSRCGFSVASSEGHIFYMFQRDVLKAIQNRLIDSGRMHGAWTFVHRGVAFGVTIAAALEGVS